MPLVRVFKYIDKLDAFIPTDEYRQIAEELGLAEWNHVVWIGRLFTLDNDYGEHWFDNWEEREKLEKEAAKLGIKADELLIVVPDRFKNDDDGPRHPPSLRKKFWTDVLKSLELSYETLFEAARLFNDQAKQLDLGDYIEDLEERIDRVDKNRSSED